MRKRSLFFLTNGWSKSFNGLLALHTRYVDGLQKGKILYLLGVSLLSSVGCAEDRCETLSCQNGGICENNACQCPEGFIGKECEISLDPCLQLMCENGDCVNGQNGAICNCDAGFEGATCETTWTQKFIGALTANEVCGGTPVQFRVEVLDGPRFNRFTIENFHNKQSPQTTAKVVADLVNPRVFNIYEQPMTFGFVTGSGSINADGSLITLSYAIRNGADTLRCSAILEK